MVRLELALPPRCDHRPRLIAHWRQAADPRHLSHGRTPLNRLHWMHLAEAEEAGAEAEEAAWLWCEERRSRRLRGLERTPC